MPQNKIIQFSASDTMKKKLVKKKKKKKKSFASLAQVDFDGPTTIPALKKGRSGGAGVAWLFWAVDAVKWEFVARSFHRRCDYRHEDNQYNATLHDDTR
jgi:hypothetical protein